MTELTHLHGNRILSVLPEEAARSLEIRLKPVELPVRTRLQFERRRVDRVYFLDSGVASVVGSSRGRKQAEVGLVGREGLTGHSVVLGIDISPFDILMQVGGSARAIAIADLRDAIDECLSLRRALNAAVHLFTVQTATTVLANAQGTLRERLARWLLMIDDRVDGPEIHLTHDYLALMLGVRRAGVTNALAQFESEGLVAVARSRTTILERNSLEVASGGFYGITEAEEERLMRAAGNGTRVPPVRAPDLRE